MVVFSRHSCPLRMLFNIQILKKNECTLASSVGPLHATHSIFKEPGPVHNIRRPRENVLFSSICNASRIRVFARIRVCILLYLAFKNEMAKLYFEMTSARRIRD